MLSKKDITLIGEILDQRLDQRLREQDLRFDQKLHDLRLDVRDEIHSCISASESRMMKYINEIKVEIIDGLTDTLDEFVFPRLTDLEKDMGLVKVRLQMV